MGQGIYGENQGTESRAAGRHNATDMRQEAMELADKLDRNELYAIRSAWLDRNGKRLDDIFMALLGLGYSVTVSQGLIARATLGKVKGKRKFTVA